MYRPVPVQMTATLLMTVQVWWAMSGLREARHWTFAGFLVVLCQAIALYIGLLFVSLPSA